MLTLELIPILQSLHEKKVHVHEAYGAALGSVRVFVTGQFHFQPKESRNPCVVDGNGCRAVFGVEDISGVLFPAEMPNGPQIVLTRED